MSDEDFGEERANLYQRIGNLSSLVEAMKVRIDEGGLDALSLHAAKQIEDLFAQHHPGGRIQRLAKIQIIVREAIRELATGEKKWNAWQPQPEGSVPWGPGDLPRNEDTGVKEGSK